MVNYALLMKYVLRHVWESKMVNYQIKQLFPFVNPLS
jgi:hypothetical protein